MKLLNLAEISALIGTSEFKIKRLLREGSFPEPVYISRGAVWRPDQVKNWLLSQRSLIDRRIKRVEGLRA